MEKKNYVFENLIKNNNFSTFRREEAYQPYDLQFQTALDILSYIEKDARHIILQGKTQAGKTGVFEAICNLLHCNVVQKGIRTIYYITGDNAADLTNRMSKSKKNIINNSNIEILKQSDMGKQNQNQEKINKGEPGASFKEDLLIPDLNNCLIFIDECHYATLEDGYKDPYDENDKEAKKGRKKANVLIQWLGFNGLDLKNNQDVLASKNVFIVSCSATPWSEIRNDVVKSKPIVVLKTTDEYKGFEDFLANEQFIPIEKDLRKETPLGIRSRCEEWYKYLKNIEEKRGVKKCIIARFRNNGKVKFNDIKYIFEEFFEIEEVDSKGGKIDYDSASYKIQKKTGRNVDINELSKDKYLMIVIQGAFTMGNRIDEDVKNNIGICYDFTATKENIHTTAQGLLGRMCGYRKSDDWKETRFYLSAVHIYSLSDYFTNGKAYPKLCEYVKVNCFSDKKVEESTVKPQDIIGGYGVISIHEYLKSFEGKRLGKMENFSIEKLVNLKDINKLKLIIDILPFLKEKDDWFKDEVLLGDIRLGTEEKFNTQNFFTQFSTNGIYGGKKGYPAIYNSKNVNKKAYKIILDVRDKNDVKVHFQKAIVKYSYMINALKESDPYNLKHSYMTGKTKVDVINLNIKKEPISVLA